MLDNLVQFNRKLHYIEVGHKNNHKLGSESSLVENILESEGTKQSASLVCGLPLKKPTTRRLCLDYKN